MVMPTVNVVWIMSKINFHSGMLGFPTVSPFVVLLAFEATDGGRVGGASRSGYRLAAVLAIRLPGLCLRCMDAGKRISGGRLN